MKDTCDKCKHCIEIYQDEFGKYFYCEMDQEYISEQWALDETMGCDVFEQKLDDNETKKSRP